MIDCSRPAPLASISEAEAKRLLLRRYRALFKDMHLRDARNGEYISFPPLDQSVFTRVEAAGDAWIVEADPNTGYILRARVGKSGDWVDLTEVSYTDWQSWPHPTRLRPRCSDRFQRV
jgi:hypothetical protein